MREFLGAVALAIVVAVGALHVAPYTGQGPQGTNFQASLPAIDVAPVDLSWPMPPMPVVETAAVDLSFAPIRETLPMPQRRPAATVLLLAEASNALGKGPREIGVRPDLWCADAINKWLKRIGLKGTDSALAASFRNWGKPAKAASGAVGLMPRRGGSGHVVVVAKVKGGTVYAYSPNGGKNRVRYATYPVKRFTAFRVPT